MAYLGKGPEQVLSGVASKSTFTGDGSTTTFDISTDIPAGGENDIQVFVDNVRQEPGSSASYTVGVDGSGNLRRITFNVAPAASQSIYVINPRRLEAFGQVPDNTIATAKLQDTSVTTAKITDLNVTTGKIAADAITEAKIADDAISEEHLDITTLTDQTELSALAADDDILLIYDTSAGTLKKIQRSNVALQSPNFSSVSPTSLTTGDLTGNYTIVVTGTKFDATASFTLLTDGGTEIAMDSVSRDSSTQLTGTVAKNTANLTNANEPFDIKILNGNGLNTTATDQINIDAQPVYVTASGSLGTLTGGSAMSTIDVAASDPESAGNVTFDVQSGTIPPGVSTSTVNENGVSKFRITGTPTNPSSTTTYNFVLRASDAASNTSSRSFSITVNRTFTSQSFTSSGTFSVPSGTTAVDVLVVGGGGGGGQDHAGGGGAGGLIFMPEYPVTPGGTVSVTVGCGGATGTNCDSAPFPGGRVGVNGQDSVFGTLTAKGGGGGGGGPTSQTDHPQKTTGAPGGSGGGGGGHATGPGSSVSGATATQPTQPGNSGAYGFGGGGGNGHYGAGTALLSGGGGGAGAGGNPGVHPTNEGDGGIGKAYTIADGTTSVYYAGGGGGTHYCGGTFTPGKGLGGQGGGGAAYDNNTTLAQGGTANRGGGAGGTNTLPARAPGGKGVVIVRY